MIGDENDEKVLQFFKICLLIIEIIIISIGAFIFFGVSKVSAAPTTYPLDAWSVGHSGQDSGAKANGSSFSWAWVRADYDSAYINIVFTARNGTTTAHARVETNFPNFCLFSTYVWEGNVKMNLTVTRQCSGTNNNIVDYYFQMVSHQGQNITLQLKPIAPLTLLNNMSITATISGSQDVEISNDLTNDTFINATNNQTTTIVNNITENVNELKEGFINALDENNKTCKEITFELTSNNGVGGRLDGSNGNLLSVGNYRTSDYIEIKEKTNLKITYTNNTVSYERVCYYNENKNYISCYNGNGTTTYEATTPNNTKYIRYTIATSNTGNLYQKYCQTNTEATIKAIDDLSFMQRERWTEEDEQEAQRNNLISQIISGVGNIFGFLQDDDIDDPSNNITSLENDMISDDPISNLFLLPVTLYQKVINSINGTCNSINLGELFGTDLIMTCISIPSIIGNALYSVIDVLISGFFILSIRKKFIEIFENLTSLHTRRNELE